MRCRIRYLEKLSMWILAIVMVMPNLLSLFGGLSASAAVSEGQIQTVLYEGPDGSANVDASLNADGTAVNWIVTLNKHGSDTETTQQIAMDLTGGGLSKPNSVSAGTVVEAKPESGEVYLLRNEPYTKEAQSGEITFTTDVVEEGRIELSLKMLVETVTADKAGEENLAKSANTKTIRITLPTSSVVESAAPEVEESSSPTLEPVPESQPPAKVEEPAKAPPVAVESEEPVAEEASSEMPAEKPAEQPAEQPVTESIKESEEAVVEKQPEEAVKEKESFQKPATAESQQLTEESTLSSGTISSKDINTAEPVPNDYVNRSFTATIPLLRKLMALNTGVPPTPENPGGINLEKTALPCEGCRTYEVTLDITGNPPVKPVDVVLVLDRSGSMAEATTVYKYTAISSNPGSRTTYFVKVNGAYIQVNRQSTTLYWYYENGATYYVRWSVSGDDTASGSTNSNTPTLKPFYTRGSYASRMDLLKQAAINFASLVLSANSQNRVAVVSFSGPSTTTGNGEQNQATLDRNFTSNLSQVQSTINGLTPLGGTNTQAGLIQANTTYNGANPNSKKATILFTDGLPTASNGNRYQETTNTNHAHYTTAVAAARNLDHTQLFTIGLTSGMSGSDLSAARTFLDRVQNAGFTEVPNPEDLEEIFNQVYTQLDNYGTAAVVEDVIGNNFDLVADSLPQGATYNAATRKITWNIGVLNGRKALTYKVKAKDNVMGSDNPEDKLPTNEWAKLIYTDVNNARNKEMTFPIPAVHVPRKLVAILSDAEILLGDSITLGTGTDSAGSNYLHAEGGTGSYTYEWFIDGQNNSFSSEKNPTVSPTQDTHYKLVIKDQQGCLTTVYMWVRVKTGQLTIHKLDEQGKLITASPATFTLTKGGTIHTKTTGTTGIATFTNLGNGTYTLRETVAPLSYIADPSAYTVTVGWVNGAVKVTVTKEGSSTEIPNTPLLIANKHQLIDIPVNKVWEDNDDVLGLRPNEITVQLYQDYAEGKDPFRTLKLNADGNWEGTFAGIPQYDDNGKEYNYTIKEVPVAYYESDVDGFTIYNRVQVGTLNITKVDDSMSGENRSLTGAEFELRHGDGTVAKDADGNPLQGTTGEDGKLTFTNVLYGNYVLVETKAPEGYNLPGKDWEIEIGGENKQQVVIEIPNTKKATLPETGGMGTTLFTLIGLSMMGISTFLFRKNNHKNDQKSQGGNKDE